eukprot:TRINITY_DN4310_c0_g1_i1.p1 TRINITY_DN4310_c0_g1~~TRINITY_DN4310_c0_g1_i1.p1  ORF type:complete len:504 (-),score=160.40 TRINITY_DN4310_c0_g1_i1:183-1643(-)
MSNTVVSELESGRDFTDALSLLPQSLLDELFIETSGESLTPTEHATLPQLISVVWDYSIEAIIDEISDPLIKLLCLVHKVGDYTNIDVKQTTQELADFYNKRENLPESSPIPDDSELSDWQENLENYITEKTISVFLSELSDTWIASLCKDLRVSAPSEELLEEEIFLMGSRRFIESLAIESKTAIKEQLKMRSSGPDPVEDLSLDEWILGKIFFLGQNVVDYPLTHLPPREVQNKTEQKEEMNVVTQEKETATILVPLEQKQETVAVPQETEKVTMQFASEKKSELVPENVVTVEPKPYIQLSNLISPPQQDEDFESDDNSSKKSKTPSGESKSAKKTPRKTKEAEKESTDNSTDSFYDETRLTSLKVVDLRKLCKDVNISSAGLNKKGLIDALVEYSRQQKPICSSKSQQVAEEKSAPVVAGDESENIPPEENKSTLSCKKNTGSKTPKTPTSRTRKSEPRESLSPKRPLRTRGVASTRSSLRG